MNDADIEQAEYERIGNIVSHMRKQGICNHGWIQKRKDSTVICLHCNKIFETEKDWEKAYNDFNMTYL